MKILKFLLKFSLILLPLVGTAVIWTIYVSEFKEKLSQQGYMWVEKMACPEYVGQEYWRFYNDKLADYVTEQIKEIEDTGKVKKMEDTVLSCFQCRKEKHVELILFSVPELRENQTLRKEVIERIIGGKKTHSSYCKLLHSE